MLSFLDHHIYACSMSMPPAAQRCQWPSCLCSCLCPHLGTQQFAPHAPAECLTLTPDLATAVTLLHRKTALHLAAEEGHISVMQAIIEGVSGCDESGRKLVAVAVSASVSMTHFRAFSVSVWVQLFWQHQDQGQNHHQHCHCESDDVTNAFQTKGLEPMPCNT